MVPGPSLSRPRSKYRDNVYKNTKDTKFQLTIGPQKISPAFCVILKNNRSLFLVLCKGMAWQDANGRCDGGRGLKDKEKSHDLVDEHPIIITTITIIIIIISKMLKGRVMTRKMSELSPSRNVVRRQLKTLPVEAFSAAACLFSLSILSGSRPSQVSFLQ